MSPVSPHQLFTVNETAYLRNLAPDDVNGRCVAIHYQRPPETTERGQSIGLRMPILVMSLYFTEQDKIAQRVADILNKHWNEDAADPAPTAPQ